MNKINKKTLNEYQLRDCEQAETLQKELVTLGFMASRVEMDNDQNFEVIFFDGTHEYKITRAKYRDNELSVQRMPYNHYSEVSHTVRGEVYKATHKSNRVLVSTQKKVQTLIDEENEYSEAMEAKQKEAQAKIAAFLQELVTLDVEVKYHHEMNYSNASDNQPTKGKITGGYIERNGIEFSFELGQDGYISKKIRVSYQSETSLAVFMALSDNKYKV